MDINEKVELYMNEGTNIDVYKAMLDSVSAAIKVIDVAMRENKSAANLNKLKSARSKLVSAQSDLRMVPVEVFKNIVGNFFSKIRNVVLGW